MWLPQEHWERHSAVTEQEDPAALEAQLVEAEAALEAAESRLAYSKVKAQARVMRGQTPYPAAKDRPTPRAPVRLLSLQPELLQRVLNHLRSVPVALVRCIGACQGLRDITPLSIDLSKVLSFTYLLI